MRISAVLVILLLLLLLLQAQGQMREVDTIDLVFRSDLERHVFDQIANGGEVDPIELLSCVDTTVSIKLAEAIKAEIHLSFAELEHKGVRSKSIKKRVAKTFDFLHEKHLRKYEVIAGFPEIFTSGTYNCVSASALYALAFDHFDISYHFVEEPSHVYLIADPQGEAITIETTNPNKGYETISEKFKKTYIEYLAEQKIISKEELGSKSIDLWFQEYYYNLDENLDYFDIAAFQYANEGLKYYELNEFSKSERFFRIAYALKPSNKHIYLLYQSIAKQLSSVDFGRMAHIEKLVQLCNLDSGMKTADDIEGHFIWLKNKFLIEKGRINYFDSIFNYFDANLRDSVALDKIRFVYYYERGRLSILEVDMDQSAFFLAHAYELQPNNLNLKTLLSQALVQKMLGTAHTNMEVVLEELETYRSLFPTLKESNLFKYVSAMVYLQLAVNSFWVDQRTEGDKYLQMFEGIYDANELSAVEPEAIAKAYGTAWQSYTRSNDKAMSKTVLTKGLEYAPYDQALNRYLKYY